MSLRSKRQAEAGPFVLKMYSTGQLADLYGVDPKTIRTWLKPFQAAIGERIGYYYNIPQVLIILEKLGLPGTEVND